MRLPAYLSGLSPVGETLDAIAAGEAVLAGEVATQNARLSVGSADRDGLCLWESDYGLPDGTGLPLETRRVKIRTAMSAAATLTPAYLRMLCVTLGGADDGEVEEDFPRWAVQVRPVTQDRVHTDTALLEESVRALLPAHLSLEVVPCAALAARDRIFAVPSSGVLVEPTGQLAVETAQGRADLACRSVVTGAVAPELWSRV